MSAGGEVSEQERNALIMRAYEVYSAAHKATSQDFLATLESVTRGVKTYTFKHRLKSSTAIEAKVRRKREIGAEQLVELEAIPLSDRDENWEKRHKEAKQNETYEPDHVTDVLGCRYVTLYQSEIPVIVEELLKIVETHNNNLSVPPINAYEFVIYTNRPATDPLSITNDTLRIVERSALFTGIPSSIRPPESRKSAYSSVHFVFRHEVEIQHAGKSPRHEQTFFEVQIRDIFEEGWGEVQHDLLYSEKDKVGTEASASAGEQAQWSLHLNALKTFVDGCSQHASIIKANLDNVRAIRTPTTGNQSVSERKADQAHLIQELHRVLAPKRIEEQVSLGYSLLLSGTDLVDQEEAFQRLLDAASNLDKALEGLEPGQRDTPVRSSGVLTIGYYLEMEAAAARVAAADLPLAGDRELQLRGEAERIYNGLVKRFPRDPTVHMRLAKIIEYRAGSLEDFKRSEALFDRTIELVADDPTTGNDHWIAISSRIDKGVSIWKQIGFRQGTLSSDDRAALIMEAAGATMMAFDIWQQQSPSGNELNKVIGHKAASNVIFYIAALRENGGVLCEDQQAMLASMIDLVENIGGEQYPDWYKTRDNLAHGYAALGNLTNAKKLAMENFVELRARAEKIADRPLDRDEARNYLKASPLICFDTALELLSGVLI